MHAIELLLDDHESVAALFERVRSNEGGMALFDEIRATLELHRHVEVALFYPNLESAGNKELTAAIDAAIEDHRLVQQSLDELAEVADDTKRSQPQLKVIMEDVEQQIEDEEERMFPLVEEQFDEKMLERLGTEMEIGKKRYLSGGLEPAMA